MNVHELYIFGNLLKLVQKLYYSQTFYVNKYDLFTPPYIVSNFVQFMDKIVLELYKILNKFPPSVNCKNQAKTVCELYKTSVNCRNRP